MVKRAKDMAALEARFPPPKPKPAPKPTPEPRATKTDYRHYECEDCHLFFPRLGVVGGSLGEGSGTYRCLGCCNRPAAKPKVKRLTRQQRAKVRAFLRLCLRRNPHRGKDWGDRENLKEYASRNKIELAEHGIEATVFYVQDAGAGCITVRQILSDVAFWRRYAKEGV